jgi:hypothetical protein
LPENSWPIVSPFNLIDKQIVDSINYLYRNISKIFSVSNFVSNAKWIGGEKMIPEIQKALSMIDEKISELKAAKIALINAFGNGSQQPSQKTSVQFVKSKVNIAEGTRKDEVVKLLQAKGPLTRSEIKNSVTFPEGTLSYVLLDKELFINKDGKWHLAEASKEEETSPEH